MSAQKQNELDETDGIRRTSERIERLLGELRTSIAPASWARVEELLASLTSIYGRGFERVLETFADEGAVSDGVLERLCDDPLIASLLILHGLHPEPLERRVMRAIHRVRRAIGEGAGEVEIVSVDDAKILMLRLAGDWAPCPAPRAAVENALRRAIEDAAPDLVRVEVEGAPELGSSHSGTKLVQIDLRRSRTATRETTA